MKKGPITITFRRNKAIGFVPKQQCSLKIPSHFKLRLSDVEGTVWEQKPKKVSRGAQSRRRRIVENFASYCLFHRKHFVFMTLTLPALLPLEEEVKIPSLYCATNRYLRKHNIQYVGIPERQKNGNIHFHYVLSEYVDREGFLKYWTKTLNVHTSTVKSYRIKFSSMDKREYVSYRQEHDVNESCISVLESSYDKGVARNWIPSNSIDLRVVKITEYKRVCNYVSKYLSKSVSGLSHAYFCSQLFAANHSCRVSYDDLTSYQQGHLHHTEQHLLKQGGYTYGVLCLFSCRPQWVIDLQVNHFMLLLKSINAVRTKRKSISNSIPTHPVLALDILSRKPDCASPIPKNMVYVYSQ